MKEHFKSRPDKVEKVMKNGRQMYCPVLQCTLYEVPKYIHVAKDTTKDQSNIDAVMGKIKDHVEDLDILLAETMPYRHLDGCQRSERVSKIKVRTIVQKIKKDMGIVEKAC